MGLGARFGATVDSTRSTLVASTRSTVGLRERDGVFVGGTGRGSYRRGGERQELSEVLRVASRQVEDGRVNRHTLARRKLLTAAADRADAERDLVAAAAVVARAAQNVTGQSEQEGVVVQSAPGGAPQVLHRFAEDRERVGFYLEAQHARAWPFARWRRGCL